LLALGHNRSFRGYHQPWIAIALGRCRAWLIPIRACVRGAGSSRKPR